LTTTGAVSTGAITATTLTASGAASVGSLASTGAVTAKTVAITNPSATTALTINQSLAGNGVVIQSADGIPLSIQSTKTSAFQGGKLDFFTASGDMEFNGGSDGVFNFNNNSTAVNKSTNFIGANVGIGTSTPTDSLFVNGTATIVGRVTINGLPKVTGLSVYANNAAAITGGLVVNDVYKTATGELRIVV
jgi:hypothetical protein